jgi:hypothetical protein
VPSGGYRARAGRKPGAKALIRKDIALEVLARNDIKGIFDKLLQSDDMKLVLETAKYLCDCVWGKPIQQTSLSNPDGSAFRIAVLYDPPKASE